MSQVLAGQLGQARRLCLDTRTRLARGRAISYNYPTIIAPKTVKRLADDVHSVDAVLKLPAPRRE